MRACVCVCVRCLFCFSLLLTLHKRSDVLLKEAQHVSPAVFRYKTRIRTCSAYTDARASAEAYTKVKHMLQLIRTWVTRQTGVYVGSTSLLSVWWRPAVWFTRARYESAVGLGHTQMNLVSPKLSLDLIIHKYQVDDGGWVSNSLSPVHRKGYIQ